MTEGVALRGRAGPLRRSGFGAVCLLAGLQAALAAEPLQPADVAAALEQMKSAERGPFARIRWFCADGSVLAPQPYACREHGGGVQHGEWSETTRRLRAAGYPIANVIADVQPAELLGDPVQWDPLTGLLLEQFLIAADDGWIMRRARYYRGALQSEDELAGSRRLVEAMFAQPLWYGQHYALAREAARLLPHGKGELVLTGARTLASRIAEQDPGFVALRNKIHSRPEAGDAGRVRDYARGAPAVVPAEVFEQLAAGLTAAFDRSDTPAELRALAAAIGREAFAAELQQAAASLAAETQPEQRLSVAAGALERLRDTLPVLARPSLRHQAMHVSLDLELDAFSAARRLVETAGQATRARRLGWLRETARALYGIGLLTGPEWQQIDRTLAGLSRVDVALGDYRAALAMLGRVPDWAGARLHFYFAPIVERLAPVEPLAHEFIPDRLRGSPLLVYADVLDGLVRDADRLAGVSHRLFGARIGTGLRSLNPGLARGRLYGGLDDGAQVDAGGIYLVAETTAELPPVAGLLTASEGNALSHVQLLARNLGIPNVVVAEPLLGQVLAERGRAAVLAASPGGVVELALDGSGWDAHFPRQAQPEVAIRVDLDKLDLASTALIVSSELRAADSGRRVGPKAAQVGELNRRFAGRVSAAIAIPFGVFRQRLELPAPEGEGSLLDWMRAGYAELDALGSDPQAQADYRGRFLSRLRAAISEPPLDAQFVEALRAAMLAQFGPDASYGVFVRSDTNVEDLPGFTGAGLNLTVPNVVGFEPVLAAIRAVWASPFSERAFAWRQALMDRPEHVYASVLLHLSVPAEKSGVMVTADLADGSRDALSIVVNEGVGGGVDGQFAETLRIATAGGEVTRLASATAPYRRELDPAGGVRQVHASGAAHVLGEAEIAQLIELAGSLPEHYPQLLDAAGDPAPADIEFGFLDGQLRLFQIRPFLQSRAALRNAYLAELDRSLAERAQVRVELDRPAPDTQAEP